MSDALNIAMQCNGPVQVIALVAIIIFLICFTKITTKSIIKITGIIRIVKYNLSL